MQDPVEVQEPDITAVENQAIISIIDNQLNCTGTIVQTSDHYVFLKIDDRFIFSLFPLIQDSSVQLPDYFSDKKETGAHISVIYPNEYPRKIDPEDLGNSLPFKVLRLFKARIFGKTYFALEVTSPGLESIRRKYGLIKDRLNFKQHWVPFHFTIGVVN